MMLKIYGSKKPKGKILRKLRKNGINKKVMIHIGKKGLTNEILKNINELLKKENVIKIRVLKNAYSTSERKSFMLNICRKLVENDMTIVDVRGNTILVSKVKF